MRVDANTVFLTNLDTTLSQSEVLAMCDDIVGPNLVVSLQMPLDNTTGKPRGMAFVEFADIDTAGRAMKELNGLEVLGRVLVCVPYSPKKKTKDQDGGLERPTDAAS